MDDRQLSARIRRYFDERVGPLDAATFRDTPRSVPAGSPAGRRALAVVAAGAVVLGAIAAYGALRPDDDGGTVEASQPSTAPSPPDTTAGATTSSTVDATTAPVTTVASDWPLVVTATPNVPEVLLVNMETGDVVETVAPEPLQRGGIAGVDADRLGRIAVWAEITIHVRDADRWHAVDVPVLPEAPGSAIELRVELDPSATAIWVAQQPSPCCGTAVWRIDYTDGSIASVPGGLPSVAFPVGVLASGALVLEGDATGDVVVVAPDLSVTQLQGTVVALLPDGIVLSECPSPGRCDLVVERIDGSEAVRAAGPDGVTFTPVFDALIPGDFAAFDVASPDGSRVLVGFAGPEAEAPGHVGVLDVRDGSFTPLAPPDTSIVAAFWDCAGEHVAVVDGGQLRALDGSIEPFPPPRSTFVVGLGACAP